MQTSHNGGPTGSQEAGHRAARTDPGAGCLNRRNRGETLAVRSQVTAGGVRFNHSEALVVRSEVRAGANNPNHSEALVVRSDVRAGGLTRNHSEALVVRTDVRAGVIPIGVNHSQALAMPGGSRA